MSCQNCFNTHNQNKCTKRQRHKPIWGGAKCKRKPMVKCQSVFIQNNSAQDPLIIDFTISPKFGNQKVWVSILDTTTDNDGIKIFKRSIKTDENGRFSFGYPSDLMTGVSTYRILISVKINKTCCVSVRSDNILLE